ncbi:MAG: EAL domain-containing protein [Eubacteriaceae bacterium]
MSLNMKNKDQENIPIDTLTGLGNRQGFLRELEMRLKKVNTEPLTVMILAINRFKWINERFGHKNGDLILKELGKTFLEIGDNQRVFRVDGDQFAFLLKSKDLIAEKEYLESFLNLYKEPMRIGRFSCFISFAIGLIRCPEVGNTLENIIGGLDYTIETIKKEKTEIYAYCSKGMLHKHERKKQIAEILEESFESNRFEVYFQPIWSVKKKKFTAAEGLLRLKHTSIGSISPGEFIPMTEETGLIFDLTYEVLTQGCNFIKKILGSGGEIEWVSINISVLQIMQKDLKEKILKIINCHKIPPSKIKIEITESALIEDFEHVKSFVEDMEKEGILFSLDDFGTGYSNMAAVLEIPFQTIKIDQSILKAAMKTEKSKTFMEYITMALKKMNFDIVVEGVESLEEKQFSVYCGCDYIQGYYYARPMTNESGKELLCKN